MANNWKKCGYSRRDIDRAGQILRVGRTSNNLAEYLDSYSIMDNWRASHAFPLNTIQMALRRASERIDIEPNIVQRLKRAPSVISKLRRYQDMQLSRMQDLGGCRAILSDISRIEDIRRHYSISRHRHQLVTEKDYIEYPQDSGYRGIHLIFRYRSDRTDDFNGHRIEVQLRTKAQHAWATAVEIAGIFTRNPLKSSIGPVDWLDFFRYSSSLFSDLEGTPRLHKDMTTQQIKEKILAIDKKIDARSKLESFRSAHDHISSTKRKTDTHFILTLNLGEQKTIVEAFGNISLASLRYAALEREFIDNELVDVVLVAAESIESVTNAYPNYFVDTTAFLVLLNQRLNEA